jgi:hypothetical protein
VTTVAHKSFISAAALASAIALSTAAHAGVYSSDFSSPPAGLQLRGDAVVEDGVLKLTPEELGKGGTAVVEDLDPGKVVKSFTATFNLHIGGGDSADGFSFDFGKMEPLGLINEEGQFYGQPTFNGLAVSFDTYDNGGDDHAHEISLFYNQQFIASSGIRELRNAGDDFYPVSVTLDHGKVTVTQDNGTDPLIAIDDAAIPGFDPQAGWQFAMGARTGASYDAHYVDDLSISTYAKGVHRCQETTAVPLPAGAWAGLGTLGAIGLSRLTGRRRRSNHIIAA